MENKRFVKIKYDKFKLKTIENNPDDIYISCISYESRTLGVLKKLSKEYKCNLGLFIFNKKFKHLNKVKKHYELIEKIINNKEIFLEKKELDCSIENPVRTILQIDKSFKNLSKNNNYDKKLNITLDISTFPRGELLSILFYLRNLKNIESLRILYISPKDYGIWLSKGYKRSIIPPFFEGPPTFEKKVGLLIITGFEDERPLELIDDIEPSFLILGRSNPGTSDIFSKFNKEIVDKINSRRKIESVIKDIPTDNPFDCKIKIKEIINEYSEKYNFYITSLITKLSVLGTFLAYEEMKNEPNFRLIYPIPIVYNIKDYSTGCRDVYQIIFNNH
ncbi:MAG: hypothetical protein ACFFG0_18655 [Candidatus Thorarchaeota archaeon]